MKLGVPEAIERQFAVFANKNSSVNCKEGANLFLYFGFEFEFFLSYLAAILSPMLSSLLLLLCYDEYYIML